MSGRERMRGRWIFIRHLIAFGGDPLPPTEPDATAVLALLDERDALRAQVERVRALADGWEDFFPWKVDQIRDALDGPQ